MIFHGCEDRTKEKSYVVYLKEGDQIADILNIMEAHVSLMELENIRILKDMRNTVNRKVNCETANINKTVSAAVKQLEDGSYVANDIDIKGEDALSYYDRMTLISEAGIYDSGFLKLRELSVSYPVWDKNGINVNLNVFARNIILWSELKGLDPEASQGNNIWAVASSAFLCRVLRAMASV